MDFLKEFLTFVFQRKKYWLFPAMLILVLVGGLLILAKGTVVAPFIYTLF
jgi:hypothetical protein